jgi:cellulose synthase/poly-beta-1,6-N-acetylglucosamine synthase-like glycosyltransferase
VEGSLDGDVSALGHGANMAFRREVLVELGGFDPLLGAGSEFPAGEDKDVLWRAMRAGWRAIFAADLQVTHVSWRDDMEAVRVMFRYGVGAGAVVAKRRRIAGERGLAAQEMWRHGLLPAARAARRGRWSASAGALARSAGVVEGAVRARRLPMRDGRLVDPG